MNRDEYEKDLKRRQLERLAGVRNDKGWQRCQHDECPECIGTGVKKNGDHCIHAISCPCPKCSPAYVFTKFANYLRSIEQYATDELGLELPANPRDLI